MTEAQEQKEIISWFRNTYPQYKNCTRLSMNGVNKGKKSYITVNSLKAQGMTVGESDLCFLIPNKGFHGLLIELKSTVWNPKQMSKKQRESHKKQLDYLEEMTGLGYVSTICIGKEAAIDTIKAYLD